jgi:hypothetical protein
MARRKTADRLRHHRIPVAVATLALLALGTQAHLRLRAALSDIPPADIAVEHQEPLDLMLAISRRGGEGLLDIEHGNAETVFLSLPDDWERIEVRDADLAAVTGEPPMFGFVRWTLPAGAGVRFRLPQAPSGLRLHHQSDAPLHLDITAVDLDAGAVAHDERLLGAHGFTSLSLWP